ncbi:carbohydrate binding domain-containing protein, partial [Pontiella sp.]|uniref:phage head spike fiber domain-containing protein n=1 Tax=Pontiella sp. TaxID=2837462 RepID=UPI003566D2E4
MNSKFSVLLTAALLCAASSERAAAAPPLPDPDPVFESRGAARQDPIFQVETFAYHQHGSHKGAIYEQPSFQVGNKAVMVRRIDGRNRPDKDQNVTIYIDNKQVACFMWWGSFKGGGYGYPYQDIKDDPDSLTIDKKARTVTYRKPYLTPAGKRAVFTYHLNPLKDSRIELSWDMGVSQQELENSKTGFGAVPWYTIHEYKGKKLTLGGTTFKEASREQLVASKNGIRTPATGDFVYNASDPVQGYTLELGELTGQITESIHVPKVGDDRYGLINRARYPKPRVTGKIIIDLGEAALPQQDTPPPVGGIDFWKDDATHVPMSPTRNVMPNPSFEQGLRYWTWIGGGATYKPDEAPRQEVVPGGKFGKKAVMLRNTQHGAPGLMTFPLSLDKGQVYTLSFYAKSEHANSALKMALKSAARGGRFGGTGPWGDTNNPDSKFTVGQTWKRYSRTFTADAAGVSITLLGGNNTLVDGIQLEKGSTPTEFVSAPLDGMLTTADPDNSIVKGKPINAEFTIVGKPGTAGEVTISAKNAFREIVYSETFKFKIDDEGLQTLKLDFQEKRFGEGVFVVKAAYTVKGVAPYCDYYRLSIMTPLSNTHATKNIFGTLGHYARISRGEDLARKYMEWGFGSTSWGYSKGNGKLRPELEKKYRIANIATMITSQDPEIGGNYRKWTEVTPEMEARIEQVAYESAKLRDPEQYDIWAFGNEEEGSGLVRNKKFDEYFKAQAATARGVKRAMPTAKIMPTCGTSGYSRLRGYDAIEGYLKAAQKHGLKYDALAVHPYGNIDRGTLSNNDLDEETARLIAQMERYGYGRETPIHYTEMFNTPEAYVPAWSADTAYDHYQAGKPTYDFGNREFIHAASAARAWLIMLKYWPRVQSSNIWVSRPFLDLYLTPLLLNKVANTLGTHLGYVEYLADIKPAAGIRGYAFRLKDGTGVAAVWCVSHDVENGLTRGPAIQATFGQSVEFVDLMGNPRSSKADKAGNTSIQLTPAPLLIKAKDAALLAMALQAAETNDAASAISVSLRPELGGEVNAVVKNLTGRGQSGTLRVADKTLAYSLKPDGEQVLSIPDGNQGATPGKMYKWDSGFKVDPSRGTGLVK